MFEQAFKKIDDVLWKDAGCTSELDYTEQTSWLLFLNLSVKNPNGGEEIAHRSPHEIMDEIAALDAESAEVLGNIKALLKETDPCARKSKSYPVKSGSPESTTRITSA